MWMPPCLDGAGARRVDRTRLRRLYKVSALPALPLSGCRIAATQKQPFGPGLFAPMPSSFLVLRANSFRRRPREDFEQALRPISLHCGRRCVPSCTDQRS